MENCFIRLRDDTGYCGFVRINGRNVYLHGIPSGCSVKYCDGSKFYDSPDNITVQAVFVLNTDEKIIMEGARRGFSLNSMQKLKSKLSAELKPISKSSPIDDILAKASELFGDNAKQERFSSVKCDKTNPFCDTYPDSQWQERYDYKNRVRYYEGVAKVAGERLKIKAVPANAFSICTFEKNGFTKCINSFGGEKFFLKVERINNNE